MLGWRRAEGKANQFVSAEAGRCDWVCFADSQLPKAKKEAGRRKRAKDLGRNLMDEKTVPQKVEWFLEYLRENFPGDVHAAFTGHVVFYLKDSKGIAKEVSVGVERLRAASN